MFTIIYAEAVVNEDLPGILEPWKSDIRKAIESKLMSRPEVYSRPLRRSLKGYRKLKVGGYRVIFRIEEEKIIIFVIQHRSIVYDSANKRT
jgi:mRNA interferase RelE/StbE